MRKPILMPTLSDTMETGHLIDWLKQPGDAIKKGDALAEVETDKAVMDVEAFHDGYLASPLATADTDIPVGTVIGYIVDSVDGDNYEKKQRQQKPIKEQTPKKIPAMDAERTKATVGEKTSIVTPTATTAKPRIRQTTSSNASVSASPYARGLARELDIDLTHVMPGPDGRIRATQVMATALDRPEPDINDGPDYELQSLNPMQRAIANNMMAASATPTFHVSARLSLTPLKSLAHLQKYSLTLLLARACALCVEAHPRFNAIYTSQGLAQRKQINIGIAVDVLNGLVTPVLRDAAGRPMEPLAREWESLKGRASGKQRSQRLMPQDYRGATFYLSNLGMFSKIIRFDAVVPLGSAAILAVAAVQDDGLAEFTLSCDHRVVYGVDAARFLETLALLLGEPKELGSTANSDAL